MAKSTKRKPRDDSEDDGEREVGDDNRGVLTDIQLDKITGREMARIHVDRIWSDGDPGEQELLMQFLHLLHARKRSLNPDDVDTRRADFDEQMKLVFEGS